MTSWPAGSLFLARGIELLKLLLLTALPALLVDSGRGCGMQDNQLSIVEKIQSLWSANSSEILIIISTVGLDNMVIRVTEYHPSGFTKIYFYSLSHISLTGSPQSTRPPEYILIKN